MKWKGRQGSGNVEDRRGMSTGKMAVGGGIGTIVIVLLVLLLGGDPSSIMDTMPVTTNGTETAEFSAEEQELADFVSVVLKDTETVWQKLFAQAGATYRMPKLVLFSGQVQSACGYAAASSGPFYCPGDEKVYIDLSFCNDLKTKFGAYGDFAIAYVIAHEIGHHVQNLLGILEEVNSQRSRLSETRANQLLVRLELQADFLAGVWAHYEEGMGYLETGDIEEAMNAAASVGDDVLQKKYQGRVYPDSFTHGSAAQRKAWFTKGYRTGDVDQGDTFNAEI
ncbi:MAG TPA: neutral zinc metallopeptidase [Bacteroidales bacterium]|nr:neutral zinc metallopeptidase [Bacteroidales bacterium]HPF02623.1 neutral zinc metallopeptidase [Bacteroidales bacterium]HPJ59081.1 neutral zinc metallopeptidase [Bacteroidales bacterium]HPR11380.1 neutral zinc metallopeptidase [Bacteroidales bacterium]HRW85669.1 neutral zinc metallopeptidase [Bacteroidales bacterium]